MKKALFSKYTMFRRGIAYMLSILFCLGGLSACNDDYDDTELRNDIENLEERVASLEAWQKSVNTNIQSLQSLVAALENENFITNVVPVIENDVEVGYKITFRAGDPIVIRHGANGSTPLIGVAKDTDGIYYWTLDGQPLLDDAGNKLPVTGAKGDPGETGAAATAPQVRINSGSNEWEISTDGGTTWTPTGVKATGADGAKGNDGAKGDKGDRGDAIFAEDGVAVSDDGRNVTFTLADGTTTFTVPIVRPLSVGFDSSEVFLVTAENKTIDLQFAGLTKEIYGALVAELKAEDGTTAMDIVTRTTGKEVEIAEPVFDENGSCNGTTVTINKTVTNGAKAVLKVTLIDNVGQEITVSRVIKFELAAADLSNAVQAEGSTVHLDENKTYQMPTTIGKGVTIEGNGATITTTASQTLQAENLTISNATLSCTSDTKKGKSMMAVAGTGITLDNVQVTASSTEYGIEVQSNASVTIKNSKFDQTTPSRAVFARDNANITLESCEFSADLTYAYNGSGNLTAKNCTFHGWLSGWHKQGTFENCTFEYGNAFYPATVCYGNTVFKACTFGKYGHPCVDENSQFTRNPIQDTTYGYDCWVSCGAANVTITFTDCKYSNGEAFGTDIFIRKSGDGKQDPSKIIIDGTEYTDIENTFRIDTSE